MTIECNHDDKKPVDVIGIEIMLCDECAEEIKDLGSH
jgi:hypothetical protein